MGSGAKYSAGGGERVVAGAARAAGQSRPGRRGLHIPTSLCCRSRNQWLSDRLLPVRRKCRAVITSVQVPDFGGDPSDQGVVKAG